MPLGKRHKEQKSKNRALLFILVGIVIFFFILTVVKVKAL